MQCRRSYKWVPGVFWGNLKTHIYLISLYFPPHLGREMFTREPFHERLIASTEIPDNRGQCGAVLPFCRAWLGSPLTRIFHQFLLLRCKLVRGRRYISADDAQDARNTALGERLTCFATHQLR